MSFKLLLALTLVLACGSAEDILNPEILDYHCQLVVDGFNGLQDLLDLSFDVDFGSDENRALSGTGTVYLRSELDLEYCSYGSQPPKGGKSVIAKLSFESSMIKTQERKLLLGPGEITLNFELKRGDTDSFVPTVDVNLTSLDLKLTDIEERYEPLSEEQKAAVQKVLQDKLLPVAQKSLQISLPDGMRFETKEDLIRELMLNVYQANAQNI